MSMDKTGKSADMADMPHTAEKADMADMPAMPGSTDMEQMPPGAMTNGAMTTMGKGTPSAHFFASIILGIWLLSSPFALGYTSAVLTVSDAISGSLVVGFSVITLVRKPSWAPWASSLVGVWLLFAPLLVKVPTAVEYANNTLVGVLIIAIVLLMPGMPGMPAMKAEPGPDIPRGWSYNPSSWPQRAPIIGLALLGFFLSRQMAGYQLGYTPIVWEPFFDPGTAAVLTSSVSKSFPISDAGLGAVAYIVEALMGFMGDKRRWRTMPWMVAFFGILVVPLGVVSVGLIILQPVSVGEWCTPCLIAGVAMLIMIALTLDEVVATLAFLAQARREGQSLWRTFWLGGELRGDGPIVSNIRVDRLSLRAMVWGVTVPWNLVASAALGVWLMAAPSVFGTTGLAAHSDHVVGALVVVVAVTSTAEVGRIFRRVNILFGIWFLVSPWFLSGGSTSSIWNDVAVGVALILLSIRRGPIREQYGAWQRFIR